LRECERSDPTLTLITNLGPPPPRCDAPDIVQRTDPWASIRDDAEADLGATIEEDCPKCGHGKMAFHTMQLRSVDEGATIFYTCLKCGYKFSLHS
jgi:DNA-directed RNA polymerase subunit M/transcription elongation factor TFIIS